jgi:hypothetical protein
MMVITAMVMIIIPMISHRLQLLLQIVGRQRMKRVAKPPHALGLKAPLAYGKNMIGATGANAPKMRATSPHRNQRQAIAKMQGMI